MVQNHHFQLLSDSGESQKSMSSESVDELSASLNSAFVTVTVDPVDCGKQQTLVPSFVDPSTGLGGISGLFFHGADGIASGEPVATDTVDCE